MQPAFCAVSDCNRPARCRDLCNLHYQRQWKHGDASVLMTKHTPNGEVTGFILALPQNGDGCIDWPYAKDKNGRAKAAFKGRMQNAARIVCELNYGPPPTPQYEAAHNCGRGQAGCIAPWHLRWATPTENQADRFLHGTDGRGERNSMSKLNVEQVAEIKRLIGRMKHKEIGALYGVSRTAIGDIANGRRWGWAQ
jgi:hypothetical protein